MAFQRKLPPGRIVVENSYYCNEHDAAVRTCRCWTLFDLRAGLAQVAQDYRLQGTRGSRHEALVTLLIERGDYPKLKDSTGRVWT